MTFLRCFTLATALFLSPLATPHHVVFEEIEEIETAIKQLYSSIKNGHAAWISYSSLDFARDQLRANLQKLIRALQAAHHRRLSIDLLPNDTLRKLFDAAARKARSHHHQLLLRHPSGLLQIETSYVNDGHDLSSPLSPSSLATFCSPGTTSLYASVSSIGSCTSCPSLSEP
jgi:hypothetical protein